MTMKWDTVLTATLLVCAVVTTGLVVRREFFAPAIPSAQTPQKPVFIDNWKMHLEAGAQLGPPSPAIQLIEFADFECPYCATFHQTLKLLRERYPTQVGLTYVHYPLKMHRFAEPAARAAECAGNQGRFEAMYDRLFDEQKSLGLKSWSEYAAEAGVADKIAFEACIKDTAPIARIESGKRLAEQLDIQGTPTLIVNGWKLQSPPSAENLERMVKAVLAGKSPIADGTS